MGTEIERKFLVTSDAWRASASAGTPYQQAYLYADASRSVRVRVAGAVGSLTIKGPTRGATRDEFEYAIPVDDARAMITRLCGEVVAKTRYLVAASDGHTWEVDVFEGDNAGLVVAEVELEREDETVAVPTWAGEEVTNDRRYLNASLAKAPYRAWPRSPA